MRTQRESVRVESGCGAEEGSMSSSEEGPQARVHGIRTSLDQLVDESDRYRRWHFKRAQLWGRVHIILGLPAAALSATAGATGLASTAGRVPAGILALVAAALAAGSSFLDSRSRAQWHDRLAGGWMVLRNDAELRLRVDLHDESWLTYDARGELERLLFQRAALLDGRLPTEQASQPRPGPAVP